MNTILLTLAMAFVPRAYGGVIAAPRLAGSLGGLSAVPMIAPPVLAPSFLGTSLSAPLTLSAPSIIEAPRLMLPAAVPALPAIPVIPALLDSTKAQLEPLKSEDHSKSLDDDAAAAKVLFDGGRAGAPGPGWTLGAFEGDGGAPIHYKSREGTSGAVARVYAGGLALSESFETLFARAEKPAGNELFLWPRGHAPSEWAPTKNPFDADARDLSRAVSIAAKTSPGGKVELALHSYGVLVFQRMIQLHAEPAVAAALKALAGSNVFMLNATTHYEGSDKRLGPDAARVAQATKMVIDWLNTGDQTAEMWEAAARMNPFLAPAIAAWVEQWRYQRTQFIALAAKDFGAMMRADLQEPWDKAVDYLRKLFIKDLERDARDSGWQEALLRRANDTFQLEFSTEDAARIKKLGIRLEIVHADGDKLLSWENAKILFERLGIDAPKDAPPSGTVLTDKTGRFRARIVSGDHYFPLKRRDELAKILKP